MNLDLGLGIQPNLNHIFFPSTQSRISLMISFIWQVIL